MIKKSSLIVASALMVTIPAFAGDVEVKQAGKKFSVKKVNIKVGDKVIFINDDKVAHNVYAIINGKKVDLGLQKAGEKGSITFDETGRFRARCAIHPKMKITVTVE